MSKKVAEVGLGVLLLVICLLVFSKAIGYSKMMGQVPLTVSVVTAALLIFQLAGDFSPSFKMKFKILQDIDLFSGSSEKIGETSKCKETTAPKKKMTALGEMRLFGWLALFLISFYNIGWHLTTPIFLLLFMVFEVREKIFKSIIFSAITWLVIHLVFRVLLGLGERMY